MKETSRRPTDAQPFDLMGLCHVYQSGTANISLPLEMSYSLLSSPVTCSPMPQIPRPPRNLPHLTNQHQPAPSMSMELMLNYFFIRSNCTDLDFLLRYFKHVSGTSSADL